MKKTKETASLRSAAVAIGSPSRSGVDVVSLYIDMLCEKFRDRGIKMSVQNDADERTKRDGAGKKLLSLYPAKEGVSANDAKYNTMNFNGRACMSSDDFANYYRDLRDYKMPRFYSRAESEYEEANAKAMAERVQESGKPSKKALWLAVTKHVKSKISEIPSHLNVKGLESFAENWFGYEKNEEIRAGERKKFPVKVMLTIATVTVSLLLIVCSSVMVSRASAKVSSLENKLERLESEVIDLEGKLNAKNDMLEIRRIAEEEYGMISYNYISSQYIDVKKEEKIEKSVSEGNDSWLDLFLEAIGVKQD